MALLQRIDSEAARPYPEYVDSEKWCGDERAKYAVLKVEATSFVLALICLLDRAGNFSLSVLNGR
jgi:hypothetical protein